MIAIGAFVALRGPWGGVRFSRAAGFIGFTTATSTSPSVSVPVDLGLGQWLIEARPHAAAVGGKSYTCDKLKFWLELLSPAKGGLQTRTKVLNKELEGVFRRWYPLFRVQAEAA